MLFDQSPNDDDNKDDERCCFICILNRRKYNICERDHYMYSTSNDDKAPFHGPHSASCTFLHSPCP